jgi:hypothetical protein
MTTQTQTARKEAQLARLKAKGTPEYPALYASQPSQLRKAVTYNAQRKVVRDAKNAANAEILKDANEAVDVFNSLEVN